MMREGALCLVSFNDGSQLGNWAAEIREEAHPLDFHTGTGLESISEPHILHCALAF